MKDSLPNLAIVGVPKAGTTSLFHYLAQHPDVCGSAKKEARYFIHLWDGRRPVISLEDYARLFDGCTPGTRYRMEATPQYFYGGRLLIDAMVETLPDPSAVVVLREPADRLWSVYWSQSYKRASLTNSLKDGLDGEWLTFLHRCEAVADADPAVLVRGEADWVANRLVQESRYGDVLDDWLETLGPRFKVVFFDDLCRDPAGVSRHLFDWLDLDADRRVDVAPRNPTVWPRRPRLHEMAQRLRRRARLAARAPRLDRAAIQAYQRLNTTPGAPRRMDDSSRARIQALYADSNGRVADSLRRHGYTELPQWLAGATAVDA